MAGRKANRAHAIRKENLLPPSRFVPVSSIEWARSSKIPPPFIRPSTKKPRGNLKKGLDYEDAFSEYMEERFEGFYVPHAWFQFKEIGKEKTRWCQPDGLLFAPRLRRIYIVETKLKHTPDAWWQLKQLYLPVVASLFPPDQWEYCLIEVTKWYDPAIRFPEKVTMCPDVLSVQPGDFGVHIWKAR